MGLMKKLLLTILILLFALPAYGALEFTGVDPSTVIGTETDMPQIEAYATISFFINPDAISGDTYTVMNFFDDNVLGEQQLIYIEDSKLHFHTTAFDIGIGADPQPGIFSVPISADTDQMVCARWDIGSTDAGAPDVWINGVDQTVTTENSPDSANGHRAGVFHIGYQASAVSSAGVNAFDGEINAVSIKIGDLGDDVCERISSSQNKQFIHEFDPDYYWRLDQIPIGDITATSTDANQATSSRSFGISFFEGVASIGEKYFSK